MAVATSGCYCGVVVARRRRETQPLKSHERLQLRADGSLRLAVVADTHSAPHRRLHDILRPLRPDAILHAGDIGELQVLDDLASIAQVFAVRGNIDVRLGTLPDLLVLEICTPEQLIARLLMLHVGVYGPTLRSNVARLAKDVGANLVLCGHSHVPFIGQTRGISVFNPGSAGPRRFVLPITFGIIELTLGGVRMRHVSCETGQTWEPPA